MEKWSWGRSLGCIQEMSTAQITEQLTKHEPDNSSSIDISDELVIPDQDIPFTTGGFGVVYRGILHDGQQVAVECLRLVIKQTDEGLQAIKRFRDELRIWSQCKHPNVRPLLGITQYRQQLAMVLPWMHGTLKHSLSLNSHPVHELYDFCHQIARGVAYLHGMGMVHGDIKAASVLVSADRTVALADIGSTIIREHSFLANSSTEVTGISHRWMAPELLEGSGIPTAKSDIYSLGMTILEVITRLEPYAGLDTMTVLQCVLSRKLPERPERHLPSADRRADRLWALLHECWAEDPQSRPIADEVATKLQNLETKFVE
ncbi:putative serine/threonine-protein kinase drkD [Rhizoctonia solani]|uniref:Putative serine/threonine-protein kinase drkD n=1 Tax=Rhizoctonia solani TaxID=456999 RepID=A0A0K6G7S6_9AGAM|nr:putative serine/threonine-protein kinase drkD [Rhizoctonia solani]